MNKIIKKLKNYGFRKQRILKVISVFVAFNIFIEAIIPLRLFAISGGPDQPETSGFEPIGTTQMVDPFTGDFTYNIPLMDIDGYPINISYHSGVTMDQEASWVGLGWSLNPGSINRGMRGIPDDFNGEIVEQEINMKENSTDGVTVGLGMEIFGKKDLTKNIKLDTGSLNISAGFFYNNYSGIGCEFGIGPSFSISLGSKGNKSMDLGAMLTLNSDNGLSINPNLSYSYRIVKNSKSQAKLGLHTGCSYNSRAGLRNFSFGGSMQNEQKFRVRLNAGSAFDFGLPTYTPEINYSMKNNAGTASFTLGGELFGIHGNVNVKYYYSRQKLLTNIIKSPAYGYFNSDNGQNITNAMHDVNRENDGSFNTITVALPITNYTYDVYSVTGQGVGGSYRPFRSDMGYLFDPKTSNSSESWSVGGEVGAAATFHGGVDIDVASIESESGKWINDNSAAGRMSFKSTAYGLYEKSYFKEASEKSVNSDPTFMNKIGNYHPVRVKLTQERVGALDVEQYNISSENILVDENEAEYPIASDNYRLKRDRRNQTISFITRKELHEGLGLMNENPQLLEYNDNISASAKGHHIAEITVLNTSGQRYIYGIAAYNLLQEETTFAVSGIENNGVFTYNSELPNADNSLKNDNGKDNYYSNTKMPAYAHSYLLTAVLSADYVDSDGLKGPSDGDIGNYTKLNYRKVYNSYNWRTPMGENVASFQNGLSSVDDDNKASYIYGNKELWYLDTIETKNYIAVFVLENRKDGYGVIDKNGKVGGEPMKLLRKISLYSKIDYRKNGVNAVPVKEVHFVYDYSRCVGIPNNKNEQGTSLEPNQGGKLTLKSIYFTYGKSNKAALSPYRFTYSDVNPTYNSKENDRWGIYKPVTSGSGFGTMEKLPNSEYPYVEQNKVTADYNSKAWLLTQIGLPSGGVISVEYESDDYAFVQNKKAMQMYKICGLKSETVDSTSNNIQRVDLERGEITFRFKLARDEQNNLIANDKKYTDGIDTVYFRFFMKMSQVSDNAFEYVSGYGAFDKIEIDPINECGLITLKNISLKDDDEGSHCPAIKAAVLFGRLNLNKEVYNRAFNNVENSDALEIANAIINAVGSLDELFDNANNMLYTEGIGKKMMLNKSWIRLNNTTGHKYGGGSRVKRIFISDEWNEMTSSDGHTNSYGQEYLYVNKDGSSSGVASYEPQIGGDENPWKMPVAALNEKGKDGDAPLAADDDHYVETPFGESFFPSPNVGYARVTIKNVYKDANGVHNNKSGSVVHEFYTAKDFPTITNRTDIKMLRAKSKPYSIRSLFKTDVKDYCTVSQGFVVEVNDMHGKPKSQIVYQQGDVPISSIEYRYKNHPFENAYQLDNTVKVIHSNGAIENNATIGVFVDFVSDMREEKSSMNSYGGQINVDYTFPAPFTLMIWPSWSSEETQFRSAVVTKVIQRSGILEKTIARDLGSEVSTDNLAYDAETGEVLVTQTTTNFNDNIFSMTFPAYWHYDGMGAAYKNIGYTRSNVSFLSGIANIDNAKELFFEGDELSITESNGDVIVGWVSQVMIDRIQVIERNGNKVTDMNNTTLKVIRSGRRNQQSTPMASITGLSNPLQNIQSNVYDKVIQASAIEYSNTWKTFCDCFAPSRNENFHEWIQYMTSYTTNPYVMGTKGVYKPNKSFLHLSNRTQSSINNNTNIRKDGVFTSFTPYYKYVTGRWITDPRDWTFTSEITLFSPFGTELENKDALGRYSAALFGYNQSLATAVVANSKYRETGVDNFEDYGFSRCADNHFKFNKEQTINVAEGISHTGRYSIKVAQDSSVKMVKQMILCNECDSSSIISNNLNFVNYKVTGGTGPFVISWICNENEIDISLGDDRRSVVIEKVAEYSYQVKVTVVDRNGCTHSKVFEFINGVLQ